MDSSLTSNISFVISVLSLSLIVVKILSKSNPTKLIESESADSRPSPILVEILNQNDLPLNSVFDWILEHLEANLCVSYGASPALTTVANKKAGQRGLCKRLGQCAAGGLILSPRSALVKVTFAFEYTTPTLPVQLPVVTPTWLVNLSLCSLVSIVEAAATADFSSETAGTPTLGSWEPQDLLSGWGNRHYFLSCR